MGHRPINLDEEFLCSTESDNPHDKYRIKIIRRETIAGYVSKETSR